MCVKDRDQLDSTTPSALDVRRRGREEKIERKRSRYPLAFVMKETMQESNGDDVIHHTNGEKPSISSSKTTWSPVATAVLVCAGVILLATTAVFSYLGIVEAGAAARAVTGGGEDQHNPGQDVCHGLPFIEAGAPISIKNLSFNNARTQEYYGLFEPAYACCASERQLLCTDGNTLVYGVYILDTGHYSVGGRTRHCIDSVLGPVYYPVDESTWGDDSINNDLREGLVEDRLYVLHEFGLNCSTAGPIHQDDQ